MGTGDHNSSEKKKRTNELKKTLIPRENEAQIGKLWLERDVKDSEEGGSFFIDEVWKKLTDKI